MKLLEETDFISSKDVAVPNCKKKMVTNLLTTKLKSSSLQFDSSY